MEARPATIKVSAAHRENVRAAGADVSVSVKSSPAASAEVGSLVDELTRFGLPADAIRHPASEAAHLQIHCENLEQMAGLLRLLGSRQNVTVEEITWQYADDLARATAREQALRKAAESARKVAASLGMRLLDVYRLDENVSDEVSEPVLTESGAIPLPAGKTLQVRLDVEYRVTGFSQARVDFMMLRASGNLFQLLRKELSTRWFRFKFGITSRPAQKNDELPATSSSSSGRALVAGHFSIPGGGGTFGDIEAQEMVCQWLAEAGIAYDVAANNEDGVAGVKIDQVDERKYGIFIFVCGPWYPQQTVPALLLAKFKHCVKIGVNLTIFENGNAGFDHLIPRDRLDEMRADIAFARQLELLPVVGVLLVERQKVYGIRQRHRYVRQTIDEYLEMGEVAPVWLDTNANNNSMGIKTAQQFESVLRRTDLVITNRLHGLVLSLKNSVPVIAIDAVAGGGKVSAQAKTLGWPMLIPAEELDVDRLRESVRMCLSSDPGPGIRKSQELARSSIEQTKSQFMNIVGPIRSR